MIKILAIVCLAVLPTCAALNCYFCASGMTGCNDPFNATAYNVTTYSNSANTHCVKTMLTSTIYWRYGSSVCVAQPFLVGLLGMACCETDLCNGAQGTYQVALLVTLSSLIILFKIY